ncbi:unnamed protein product [Didymodactylos carnosus]|nr:unnamed protein product [Didymodactylos carnosus]CAF4274360.1 unnamed protein product [Didymodactylos carnosus]
MKNPSFSQLHDSINPQLSNSIISQLQNTTVSQFHRVTNPGISTPNTQLATVIPTSTTATSTSLVIDNKPTAIESSSTSAHHWSASSTSQFQVSSYPSSIHLETMV